MARISLISLSRFCTLSLRSSTNILPAHPRVEKNISPHANKPDLFIELINNASPSSTVRLAVPAADMGADRGCSLFFLAAAIATLLAAS